MPICSIVVVHASLQIRRCCIFRAWNVEQTHPVSYPRSHCVPKWRLVWGLGGCGLRFELSSKKEFNCGKEKRRWRAVCEKKILRELALEYSRNSTKPTKMIRNKKRRSTKYVQSYQVSYERKFCPIEKKDNASQWPFSHSNIIASFDKEFSSPRYIFTYRGSQPKPSFAPSFPSRRHRPCRRSLTKFWKERFVRSKWHLRLLSRSRLILQREKSRDGKVSCWRSFCRFASAFTEMTKEEFVTPPPVVSVSRSPSSFTWRIISFFNTAYTLRTHQYWILYALVGTTCCQRIGRII